MTFPEGEETDAGGDILPSPVYVGPTAEQASGPNQKQKY